MLDSKHKLLAESTSQDNLYGPLRLSYITKNAGVYTLLVRPIDKRGESGSYHVEIDKPHSARSEDRLRVAAEQSTTVAEQYARDGDWRSALNKFDEAIRQWERLGDVFGQAQSFEGLGDTYYGIGDLPKAVQYHERALSLYRSLSAHVEEARVLNAVGEEYASVGQHNAAVDTFHRSLELSIASGDRQGQAISLRNMGLAYQITAEYDQALDSLSRALELSRTIPDAQTESSVLLSLGNVYSNLNEPLTALDFLAQARARGNYAGGRTAKQIDFYAINAMGRIRRSLGQRELALELLTIALRQSRLLNNHRTNARLVYDLGTIYEEMGDQKKALALYNEAHTLARKSGDVSQEVNALYGLATLFEGLGRYREALTSFNNVLLLSRKITDRHTEVRALYSLARIYKKQEQLDKSLEFIKQTVEVANSIRYDIGSEQLRSSYFVSVRSYYEFYIDLLMQLGRTNSDHGYDLIALQVSEESRAISLLEALSVNRRETLSRVDPNLLERERSLRMQLSAKATVQLSLGAHTSDVISEQLRQLNAELQVVQNQIRSQSPSYSKLMEPQSLNAGQIQRELLDDDSLLLEYWLGDEKSYLWAVTPTSIKSYELPGRGEIEQAVGKLYRIIARRGTSGLAPSRPSTDGFLNSQEDYQREASVVSHMLLGSVGELPQKERLFIVTSGSLQDVPFEALPAPQVRGDDKPRPLIVDHEIILLPSASTLAMLRQRDDVRREATKGVAVIADPVVSRDDARISWNVHQQSDNALYHFPRLFAADWEAETIYRLASKTNRLLAVGFAANRDLVTSGTLQDYRIIHFATHGLPNSEDELSGILLSSINEKGEQRPSVLLPQDIDDLNLSADLVVLSSCETALGAGTKDEGINRLSSSFLYAGSQSVVTSRWNVDDVATANLMTRFYEGMLKDGLQPSAALRQAQIEMSKDTRWRDPYYWAAFSLKGSGGDGVSARKTVVPLWASTTMLGTLQARATAIFSVAFLSLAIVLVGLTTVRRYRTSSK